MKEVITLQFGAYSNYIGSHFWNFQDELFGAAYADTLGPEVDPGVLYRYTEDKAGNGVFTPRTLIFDLAGSEGLQRALTGSASTSIAKQALRGARLPAGPAEGEDEADQEEDELVDMVERLAASQLPESPFFRHLQQLEGQASGGGPSGGGVGGGLEDLAMDLDSLVTNWGDYAKARFHPSSLLGIGSRTSTGDSVGSSLAGSAMGAAGRSSGHGVGGFDAFTYGSEYYSDSIEEAVRVQLEACDGLQGIQAIVDVDGGFGSLAVEVLAYLKDECPRAPQLVFGAVAPRTHHAGHSGTAMIPGPSDYAARERSSMRDVNIGLAFAHFAAGAGSDLECLFVPLSLQPYADVAAEAARAASAAIAAVEQTGADLSAVSGGANAAVDALHAWLPGLKRLVAHKHYQTSAVLAAAWDTATLAFRRNSKRGDASLPFCASEADALRREMAGTGAGVDLSSTGAHGRLEMHDGRTREGSRAGQPPQSPSSALFDPSLEYGSGGPLVGLSQGLGMKEWCGLLTPAPSLRVASLAVALPTPHPRASATVFDKLLSNVDPLHASRLDNFTPLSWVASGAFPRRMYPRPPTVSTRVRRVGPGQAEDEAVAEGEEQPECPSPFAHVLTARGIGTHNVNTNGSYGSSTAAYGRVLDTFMGRTQCRTAGHAVFRTPLPLPITFPRIIPGTMYDYAGAFVGTSALGPGVRPPLVPFDVAVAKALQQASAGGVMPGDAVAWPFSLPAMVHVANTPAYGPCLARVHRDFCDRDRAVVHRYTAADRTSSRASLELPDAQAALASLADDYAAEREF